MKEFYGSIWVHFLVANHFVCLTTNGTRKKNGAGVMGRGNAKQATLAVKGIEKMLGEYLEANGNRAGFFHEAPGNLIVFPVKHNWWERADMALVIESAKWLRMEALLHPERTYHLPRPGCGNGKLDWLSEVCPQLVRIGLPDNVLIHHI